MPFVEEGYTYMRDVAFHQGTQLATVYVGLAKGSLAANAALIDVVGEPAVGESGYARKAIACTVGGFPTIVFDTPLQGATVNSVAAIFTPVGGKLPLVGDVDILFVGSSPNPAGDAAGTLLFWKLLKEARSIPEGDDLETYASIKMI